MAMIVEIGKQEVFSIRFDPVADGGVTEAIRWLGARGFSVGRMQRDDPRGILRGDYDIQKWRNLDGEHRRRLDGVLFATGGPMTRGAIIRLAVKP